MKAKAMKEWLANVPDGATVEVRDRYGDYGQRFQMRVVYPLLDAKEEVEDEEPS